MTKPTGRPRGRPPGTSIGEPTVPIPARAPVRVIEAFRERHGEKWAERLRWLMENDAGLDPSSGAIRPLPHGGGVRMF